MLETQATDRRDDEALDEYAADGQSAGDGEEGAEGLREAVVGDARWPDVIFGSDLREVLQQQDICEADVMDPDHDDRHVAPLVIERAGDVTPVPTDWLWPGRVPLRRLTILAGDSRAASAVALDIAARVSRGKCWPDAADGVPMGARQTASTDPPVPPLTKGGKEIGGSGAGNVLILCAHREIAGAVVPALVRAGADMRRTFCVDGVMHRPTRVNSGWTRGLRLPDDFRSLRRSLRALGSVRLVIIDPIEPFLAASNLGNGPRLAAWVAQELADLAYEFNLAVVGVTELRRGGGRGGMGLAVRNAALSAAAHVAWGVARDPREPGRNVLVPLKMNAGRAAAPLEFTTDEGGVVWSDGGASVAGEDAQIASREGLEFAAAVTWVRALLSRGPRAKAEVAQLAREQGIAWGMIRRVTRELGVKSEKHEVGGKATWSLPAATEAAEIEKVCTIGDSAARMDDSRGISNRAAVEQGALD